MGRRINSRNRAWNWIAKLHRLAGRYDNPMPTWFLAPITGLKLPTLFVRIFPPIFLRPLTSYVLRLPSRVKSRTAGRGRRPMSRTLVEVCNISICTHVLKIVFHLNLVNQADFISFGLHLSRCKLEETHAFFAVVLFGSSPSPPHLTYLS